MSRQTTVIGENRSWLFVPGDDERKLGRCAQSGADALIFDLEDSVVESRRYVARGLLSEVLASPWPERSPQRWVRVNPLDGPAAALDLAAIVGPGLKGVVLPKTRRGADVAQLDHYLTALEARAGVPIGAVQILVVSTETPEMLFRLGELAGSSPRLHSCTWGAEDLSLAVGAASNKGVDGDWDHPYQLARSLCLIAARSAGVQPVDTLFAAFRDDVGLAASAAAARRQGFTGKLAIHPQQAPIINECFAVTTEEIDVARRVVAAFADAREAGAVSLEGSMLDRPHLTLAKRLLARAERQQAGGRQ